MKVAEITLRNFRNVHRSTFVPGRGVNFLMGTNGQGKTSFIEALGFLSTLRSFRNSKLPTVVNWGALNGDISCTLTSDDVGIENWQTELRLEFQASDLSRQKATKTAYINGKAFRSSTQYLSQRFGAQGQGFHSIIFHPSDHDLVRGSPEVRRNYLDRVLAAEDVEYLKIYQKYQRVLTQRNVLLKANQNVKAEVLEGFTEPLCRYGAILAHKRLVWIKRLASTLNYTLQQIAPGQPELRLGYVSSWVPFEQNLPLNNNELDTVHFAGQGPPASLELLEQTFSTKVSELEAAERRSGHSLVGPHRDDWVFCLGSQVLKGYGSQGEVRSALLALKLSEIQLFRNETGQRPLFLLDDFSSELDQERRTFLLRFLSETDLQTFVTTTEDSSYFGKRFWVSNGVINPTGVN